MRKGFTLIELLIVIAIIAILALIAVPNFLEAQTRAKVARVHADMRSLATAIESYYVDHNQYFPAEATVSGPLYRHFRNWLWWEGAAANTRPHFLTTPIAYFSSAPPADPFIDLSAPDIASTRKRVSYLYYNFLGAARAKSMSSWSSSISSHVPEEVVAPAPMAFNGMQGKRVKYANWALVSPGPSRSYWVTIINPPYVRTRVNTHIDAITPWRYLTTGRTPTYDPTNGTVSSGAIWRYEGGSGD